MHQRANHNSRKDRPSVVHVILGDRQNLRERHPEYDIEDVAQGESVHGDADFAHAEWTVGGRGTADLPDQDEQDWKEVRYV